MKKILKAALIPFLIITLSSCSSLNDKINNDYTYINNAQNILEANKSLKSCRQTKNKSNCVKPENIPVFSALTKSAVAPMIKEVKGNILQYEKLKLTKEQLSKIGKIKEKILLIKMNYKL